MANFVPPSPLGTPALNPLPSPQVAAVAAALSAITPREAGWRPPPPKVDEPEVWSSAQAERVAEALRQANLDPEFCGRFRKNHVTDLADDVTAYACLVAGALTRPDAGLIQRVDFARLFHRLVARVRSTLGAAQYTATVINEVRVRLQSVPGIPACGTPVVDRQPRSRGRFSNPRGLPPSRALSFGATSSRAHTPPSSSSSNFASGRGGRGARGGFGGRRGGRH